MSKGWTEERRRKQAEIIRKNKPWEKSTGPKTEQGKRRARMNALKHGCDGQHGKTIRAILHHNREFMRETKRLWALQGVNPRVVMRNELNKMRAKSTRLPRLSPKMPGTD